MKGEQHMALDLQLSVAGGYHLILKPHAPLSDVNSPEYPQKVPVSNTLLFRDLGSHQEKLMAL